MSALDTYSGQFKVNDGGQDVTTGYGIVYSVLSETGCDAEIDPETGIYTLSSVTSDNASATFRAVYGLAHPIDKTFSVAKSRAGSSGEPAKLITLSTTHFTFSFDTNGNPFAQTTTFTATKQGISAPTVWYVYKVDGTLIITGRSTMEANGFVFAGNEQCSLDANAFAAICDNWNTNGLTIEAVADVRDRVSVTKVKDGAPGIAALNSASVFLYQRNTGIPLQPNGETTYNFATGAITGDAGNGWLTAIEDGSAPLWVIKAVASSTEQTDTIPASEWSGAVKLAQNGVNGLAGLNHATVDLFIRSAGPPTVPDNNVEYAFANSSLIGDLDGWSRTPPTTNGNPLWSIRASAVSTDVADVITPSEWSAPTKILVDGTDAISSTTVFLYQRKATNPAQPVGAMAYNFTTGELTGEPGSGWLVNLPDGTETLWVVRAIAHGSGPSDVIPAAEWSGASRLGANGLDGANQATVMLYKRQSATPAKPTANTTYTFATGVLSGTLDGWTRIPPASSDRLPLWETRASAISAFATDTILATEWSAPVITVRDGEDGIAEDGKLIQFIWKLAPTAPVTPSGNAIPAGWSDNPPEGSDPLWMTKSRQKADGTLVAGEAWSPPVRQDGEDGADGPSLTVGASQGGFYYLRGAPNPAVQEITFTARLNGSPVNVAWATIPAIKISGNASTFQLSSGEAAAYGSVIVTATYGDTTVQFPVPRLADPTATPNPVFAQPGTPEYTPGGLWFDTINLDFRIGRGGNYERVATVGAKWDQTVIGRPTYLTDDRIPSGLTTTGDVARNLPAPIKSNISIDSISDGIAYTRMLPTERNKLSGVETGATVGAKAGVNLRRGNNALLADSEVLNEQQAWAQVSGTGRPQDNADVTINNIAGGLAGEGPWAREQTEVNYLLKPGANLIKNGSLKLRMADWFAEPGGWFVLDDPSGNLFFCNQSNKTVYSRSFQTSGVGAFTFQFLSARYLAVDSYAYIRWLFPDGVTVESTSPPYYMPEQGNGLMTVTSPPANPATGYPGYGRAEIVFNSGPAINGGYAIFGQVKGVFGSSPKIFTDDATVGALYGDLTDINALQPGQMGADVTALAQVGIQTIPAVEIDADANGTTTTALPRVRYVKLFKGANDVTMDGSWSLGAVPGGISANINNTPGNSDRGRVEVTLANTSGVIPVNVVYQGVTYTSYVTINRTKAAPTQAGGSGATSVTDNSFSSVTGSAYVVVSDSNMIVRSSASGQLIASVSASFLPDTGYGNVRVQMQMSTNGGGTWTAVKTAVEGSGGGYEMGGEPPPLGSPPTVEESLPTYGFVSDSTTVTLSPNIDVMVRCRIQISAGLTTRTYSFSNVTFNVRQP